MSKKSETKKAGGKIDAGDQTEQAAVATKGREHAVAKSMPKRAKTTPVAVVEPPVENAPPEPPPLPDDSGELVVFAFRLTRAERDLIHSAAGSAKASKFVRGLAVAAARADGDAVQQILTEVQQASR